jgi:hypothetical protein
MRKKRSAFLKYPFFGYNGIKIPKNAQISTAFSHADSHSQNTKLSKKRQKRQGNRNK